MKQKLYRDRHTVGRQVAVGDAVFVSAVDQLSGGGGRTWLPGVLVGREGVKLSVRLGDGRVIHRHLDRVRTSGQNVCNAARRNVSIPSVGYPPSCVREPSSRAAETSPSATEAEGDGPGGGGRYALRDRARLRPPERLSYV